ncbi:MAG: hypothetical protein FWE71_17295 [Nocardioidaceae bacterium]|nr:hypothetical protein [Nocardioidaceae bacterium]MCL2615113.1 hypothetical protein [Nocardioidaceae bacterium]
MTEVPAPAPAPTGIASVDAVLDMVAALEERPVSEHAAVFERAHTELRQALDQADSGDNPDGAA